MAGDGSKTHKPGSLACAEAAAAAKPSAAGETKTCACGTVWTARHFCGSGPLSWHGTVKK